MKQAKYYGDLLLEQEKFKEAVHIYTQAIKYSKEDEELYYNLGIAYSRINEFALAKECYEKATEINNNLYNAYYRLGQISLLYRDIEAAERYFIQSMDGEVELKSYYQLAKIYMMKNDKNKAVVFLNKATEVSKYYYDIAREEPIFFAIKQKIVKPNDSENKDIVESEKEKAISDYLDNTYDLTKILNQKESRKNKKFKM